eukprot:TRINITY_DN463_c0_g1_i2.p2 TRINITY_DN463_c0_g1~~TRINITY_DN463_c0_g1_i2.p2  ORF type:complete len:221 (+),score=38.89 TRINITY_DN463_c0_g1_i2:103-765(+)
MFLSEPRRMENVILQLYSLLGLAALCSAVSDAKAGSWFVSTTLFNSSKSCDGAPVNNVWQVAPTPCEQDNYVLDTYGYTSCSLDGSLVTYHSMCGSSCRVCVDNVPLPSGTCSPAASQSTSCVAKPPQPFNNSVQQLVYSQSKCAGEPTMGETWILNTCYEQPDVPAFYFYQWNKGDKNVSQWDCTDSACNLDTCFQGANLTVGCQDGDGSSQRITITVE